MQHWRADPSEEVDEDRVERAKQLMDSGFIEDREMSESDISILLAYLSEDSDLSDHILEGQSGNYQFGEDYTSAEVDYTSLDPSSHEYIDVVIEFTTLSKAHFGDERIVSNYPASATPDHIAVKQYVAELAGMNDGISIDEIDIDPALKAEVDAAWEQSRGGDSMELKATSAVSLDNTGMNL